MSKGTPEARTPVMIMVEAFWQDQSGTVQSVHARMQNKSPGGACLRLKSQIEVGTKLRVEGRWDKFSGVARYCRKDGRDYVVGIQKDSAEPAGATRHWPKVEPAKEVASANRLPSAAEPSESETKREENKVAEVVMEKVNEDSVPVLSSEDVATAMAALGTAREAWSKERRNSAEEQALAGIRKKEEQIERASQGDEAGKERKHMGRKWFEMGHKDEKQEVPNNNGNRREETASRAPAPVAPTAETMGMEGEGEIEADAQVELLSMDDIYRMAGILAPRKGYSITKIGEMLQSEHLRGLSKEMKRASVLMALDAAGISVEEVLQDAKTRQDAIDSYEADQRKQFEAQLTRKAEENVQIQAELERVKARYTERLRRNLDGMAREKATFGNWLTLKQQEAQSMAEAVELCLKPAVPETPSDGLKEMSLAGARTKTA
jgi:hypothetical protein